MKVKQQRTGNIERSEWHMQRNGATCQFRLFLIVNIDAAVRFDNSLFVTIEKKTTRKQQRRRKKKPAIAFDQPNRQPNVVAESHKKKS